ncbi:MAG: NAD(P)-binding domain-containing protein, partial [SAR324 cluster bacterium]|nr:NAD(P)-binding domain-containing protein [SAR324 cluster bacterium]
MKIAIMGAGGVGGFYGGRLAKAGEDVTFIARGSQLQALRQGGLRVKSTLIGDFELSAVQATEDPASVGVVDLVLMCVKAYDLDAASRAIAPMIAAGTVVIPLLNGVDIAERIGALVGRGQVLGGTTYASANVVEPGTIRHLGMDR